MTDGEKVLFDEMRTISGQMERGFRECRSDIKLVHKRVSDNEKEIGTVKGMALVSKTKIGTFIAGMVFVFSGIFTLISHYVKSN